MADARCAARCGPPFSADYGLDIAAPPTESPRRRGGGRPPAAGHRRLAGGGTSRGGEAVLAMTMAPAPVSRLQGSPFMRKPPAWPGATVEERHAGGVRWLDALHA